MERDRQAFQLHRSGRRLPGQDAGSGDVSYQVLLSMRASVLHRTLSLFQHTGAAKGGPKSPAGVSPVLNIPHGW